MTSAVAATALGASGSIRSAEELLWREHYQTPASPQTYWALWELYQRQPAPVVIAVVVLPQVVVGIHVMGAIAAVVHQIGRAHV